MEYPRELKLSPDVEARLISYLNTELINHEAERAAWVQDLKAWQEDYWATPATKEATFPFKGAANIVIPLSAIAVESIHAREMTTVFALNQTVSCAVHDPNYQDVDYELEKAIDRELSVVGVDFYKFLDHTLLENKKLGSCVGKSGYEKIVKTAVKLEGEEEVEFDVIIKQGPTADPVPVANFLMPFTCRDPQTAPWCGEEHLQPVSVVKQYADSGFFREDVMDNMSRFWSMGMQLSSTPYTQMERNLQNQNPIQWPNEIGWNEIWLSFDIDNSGKQKEIVVHYHRPSQTFFSIRYNWYSDLHRPYRIGNYFTLEHRWAGIGIGKQSEQFQMEITTQHRQLIDNATLANMRMFKAKQGGNINPNEPLFPGKIFMVDEMDDFVAIEGGSEVYPSGYNVGQQSMIYAQQRQGVNELTLGMPQVGTPGTATGDLTRVQEFNRKFDYTFKAGKRFGDAIVLDILCNQSQFGFRDRRYFVQLPNGSRVMELLQASPDVLRNQLQFTVGLIGQNQNRLVDRQSWTQYAQMLQQYYTAALSLPLVQQNPQLFQIINGFALKAATEAMQQIGEGFDIRNNDRLLIPKQLIAILTGQGYGPPPTQPGRIAPAQSNSQGAGMVSSS